MDSSSSLKLDENLARFLAAYGQELDGGDARAPTVQAPYAVPDFPPAPSERPVTPHPSTGNEGSLGELLPDHRPAEPATVTPPPGGVHRIGRFELRRQLGKGGCGIVFLAYDPKLRREVALKVPRPELLLNPNAKRRLKLEALAASEFDHPNLVPVYEWGEVGPVCFIATAFCPGQTLAGWIDRQAFPVPVRQAVRLMVTLAEAVQHAHDRGVLHRDLKPNNVILQEMRVEKNDEPPAGSVLLRGVHYVPRVVDFGLAKLTERGGPSETGTRQILGTPKYMAPEQAQARREDIGPPADVYALGVVLYELLAGRAPYDGATDVEVLRQSVEGKATQPRDLRPDLPRDLEAICLKAMARTTAERYRTAIDFADDLRRFLDGMPTVARPLAWPGRAGRWLRRNDQLVAIVVLAVIAVTVTGLGTWNSYRGSRQTAQLRTDRDTLSRDQADRHRGDRQREYAQHVRDAFLAWRGGNARAAAGQLDAARRETLALNESPDFVHDYVSKLSKVDRLTIVCPVGAVTALAVAPDGSRLATGHADGTLAVWDRRTGRSLGRAKAHDGEVSTVAFANGLLLSSVCKHDVPAPVHLWLVSDEPTLVRHLLREVGIEVTCFAVSADGKSVVLGDADGGLRLLSGVGEHVPPRAAARLTAGDRATAVAFPPGGRGVVVATAKGRVAFCSDELVPLESHGPGLGAVTALAADERGYAAGLSDGGIVRDSFGLVTVRGEQVATAERAQWVALGPACLAANTAPGRVRVGRGGRDELPTGDPGTVRAGALAPDGKVLFTGGPEGIVRGWHLPADTRDLGTRANHLRPTALAVHPSNGEFVVAGPGGAAVYNKDTMRQLATPTGLLPHSAQAHENGTYLAVTFDREDVVVSGLGGAGGERFRAPLPTGRTPIGAALTPDGTRVAVVDDAGWVRVWTVPSREVVGAWDTGLGGAVRDLAISADGRQVAHRTRTGVAVWAPGVTESLGNIRADDQAVFRFLPSSDRIAIAGRGGVVRVCTVNGREVQTLYGHVGRVTGLGVSPDGRTLVSGGATGDVKLWDLRTSQELLGMNRHSVPVTAIEFSADGRVLVTAGDGQVALWDARPE